MNSLYLVEEQILALDFKVKGPARNLYILNAEVVLTTEWGTTFV